MKKWESVKEVHNQALYSVGKRVKSIVKEETVKSYYDNPKNKGWIGNAIESDLFGIPNNNRKEADIPNLNLEIKVSPIVLTRNGWSAKERLVLNIFDFHDEYKREFKNASFFEKASLIELIYYEYLKDVPSPDLHVKAATLLNLWDLPIEDLLIIKEDWEKIVDKIREGKAEELSDSLTKYLGATTKGGKSEKNMTTQPFSSVKAHRRSFTLKSTYMTQFARKLMGEEKEGEKVVKNHELLKIKTFEELVLEQFSPYIGRSKFSLAEEFGISIPKKNDKASSPMLARKMLNVESDIQETEEFKKAGISVKIITVESGKSKTTEGLKLTIPENTDISPVDLVNEDWDDSILREYLASYQFLFVIFEKTKEDVYFKGVKFWRMPYSILETDIKETWEKVKDIFNEGVELTYKEYRVPLKSTGTKYHIGNNLPKSRETNALHIRPSAKYACYHENLKYATRLPVKSHWYNRPLELTEELTDYYMTKQAWWLNPSYIYEQVKEFF